VAQGEAALGVPWRGAAWRGAAWRGGVHDAWAEAEVKTNGLFDVAARRDSRDSIESMESMDSMKSTDSCEY
jgi:hypothetical protein